jgi:cell division protein FtsW
MLPILIVCGLIAPYNLSTAGLLFIGCLAMMFVGRIELKYIVILIGFGILLFLFLIYIENIFPNYTRADTWISRINSFIHGSGDTYQIEQAKMAIANGGWFGVLPGNSTLRNFIPYSYADFIYPIIVEEYGLLLGGMGVIIIYLMLFMHCVGIVTKTPKAFGALLTIGIGINMVLQAYSNIAVSLELIPVTGLPLPFISMGGTALLSTSIAFGMIISVSKNIHALRLESDSENQNPVHESAY